MTKFVSLNSNSLTYEQKRISTNRDYRYEGCYMANEMVDEWKLEPSVKSKKVRIDGVVRVSKKFYKRNINVEFVEVNAEDIPF